MKIKWGIFYLAGMCISIPACFAPVNSVYEDARLLRKGDVEVKGNLSSDLNQWAIRPEVGYDGYVYAGAGFCYFFNNKKAPVKLMD